MSMRDLARQHRQMILTNPNFGGEDIVYLPVDGTPTPGRGQWIEAPSDIRHPQGLAEANVSGALLDIAIDLAPALTRKDQFKRVATGEVWSIELVETIAGVGYRVHLSKPDEALAKELR